VRGKTPQVIANFTQEFCIQCHGAEEQKGEFRIDTLPWDLTAATARERWELVQEYVVDGDMPPKKAKKHPAAAGREAFLAALDTSFSEAA
jgi:mono/diheme cytochrome c family protein